MTEAGTVETGITPLAPFKNASGHNYWTANTVRKTTDFNYAYPETQQWRFRSADEYSENVRGTVQQLYGGVSNFFMAQRNNFAPTGTGAVQNGPRADTVTNGNASDKASDTNGNGSAHHSEGFFHKLIHKAHDKIFSDDDQEQTRGLDLESEIGKREHYTRYIFLGHLLT